MILKTKLKYFNHLVYGILIKIGTLIHPITLLSSLRIQIKIFIKNKTKEIYSNLKLY